MNPENNVLKITHLGYSHHSSPFTTPPVPYIRVNCTFKVKVTDPHSESFHSMLVDQSREYTQELTIDDPEKYERWFMEEGFEGFDKVYDGFGEAWFCQDPKWKYLEKFDTFQFRDAVSDNPATRFILNELSTYKRTSELICQYRCSNHGVIVRHLKALSTYWD